MISEEESLAEAQEYFDQMHEHWGGDDWRVAHVASIYDELTAEGDALSYLVGRQFLRWAVNNSNRIGEDQTDTCICIDGWIPVENDRVRLCSRCRRAAYDKDEPQL